MSCVVFDLVNVIKVRMYLISGSKYFKTHYFVNSHCNSYYFTLLQDTVALFDCYCLSGDLLIFRTVIICRVKIYYVPNFMFSNLRL